MFKELMLKLMLKKCKLMFILQAYAIFLTLDKNTININFVHFLVK